MAHKSTCASFRVASAIPGRIRVQLSADRQQHAHMLACADRLSALPGILAVVAVNDARSVVVRYAPDRHTLLDMTRAVESAVAEIVCAEAKPGTSARRASPPSALKSKA